MGFNSRSFSITARVLALLALCLVLVWGLTVAHWTATPLTCALLIALLTADLIRYVNRNNRDLERFLTSVAHQDFSTPVQGPLAEAYRTLTGEFRRLNLQKEANHRHLEAVVEHVGVALFCFDDEGWVTMTNPAGRRLFGARPITTMRGFAAIDGRLPQVLAQLGDGERHRISLPRGDDQLELVLYATTFELLQQRYKLVSFQNIRDELEQQEVDSWQKLIRVLTHEIMNSVTPIVSLSELIRETVEDEPGALPPADRADLLRGLSAIQERSSSLLEFVQAYRSFATLPAPAFADIDVSALFDRVGTLLMSQLQQAGIRLSAHTEEPGLAVRADARQLEQVLINLMRNAIEVLAGANEPRIELRGSHDEQGRVLLQVIDNGPGIDPAHLDKIFVPFFSTKHRGMGVGLSISRQIMKSNRGFIAVRSSPGEGSTFTLKFAAPAQDRT